MLVDLGRNDLGRVSKFGTVQVEKLHSIERYSHVMHIGSTVRGEIKTILTHWTQSRRYFPQERFRAHPR